MPVFHTKTIESILDPVAQQVSRLVILHEEAEDTGAMPDLTRPVQLVKQAVDNLIKVGYDTVSTSSDKLLKQDMPPALNRVQDASTLLLSASTMLLEDNLSGPARKKLIDGSRGILQGVSALLLAFDQSEVRKIIKTCKSVLEYLVITEVLERMDDLVTFVRNLSPIVTQLIQEVETRCKELTSDDQRQKLGYSVVQVRQLVPALISSIRAYLSIPRENTTAVAESKENRNFVVQKMTSEIENLIRLLQQVTTDETDGVDRQLTSTQLKMRLRLAHDWLLDSAALGDGAGQRALAELLKDIAVTARGTGDTSVEKEALNLESMMNALSELRLQDKGSSPQAMSVSRCMSQALRDLVTKLERAGVENGPRFTVDPTLAGKLDQLDRWCNRPNIHDLSELAYVSSTAAEQARSKGLGDCGLGTVTSELSQMHAHKHIDPHMVAKIKQELVRVRQRLRLYILEHLTHSFLDINTPLRQLNQATTGYSGEEFDRRADVFKRAADGMVDTSELVDQFTAGEDRHAHGRLKHYSKILDDLTTQVIGSGRLVLEQPENRDHFELMRDQWQENADQLRSAVDDCTETCAFLKHCHNEMVRERDRCQDAIATGDANAIVTCNALSARLGSRISQVAVREAENSEDPVFVDAITLAAKKLQDVLPVAVVASRNLALDFDNNENIKEWQEASLDTLASVGALRDVFDRYERIAPSPAPSLNAREAAAQARASRPEMYDMNQPLELDDFVPPRPYDGRDTPPPPAGIVPPPRPPPPSETDDESDGPFDAMSPSPEPIMRAAYDLHQETKQWSKRDNELVAAASRMALLMAKLSQLMKVTTSSKRELIAVAKAIADVSGEVTRLAEDISEECTDKRIRTALKHTYERIPTMSTQLRIMSTVKATMLAVPESTEEEDQEATEMIVGNAQNIMTAVRETVRLAEAASIKIRITSGYKLQWTRKRPWVY